MGSGWFSVRRGGRETWLVCRLQGVPRAAGSHPVLEKPGGQAFSVTFTLGNRGPEVK